jgi:hypothetical protein
MIFIATKKPSIFKIKSSSLAPHQNPLEGKDGKTSMGSLQGCGDNSGGFSKSRANLKLGLQFLKL